jgi:hypothetical protein
MLAVNIGTGGEWRSRITVKTTKREKETGIEDIPVSLVLPFHLFPFSPLTKVTGSQKAKEPKS